MLSVLATSTDEDLTTTGFVKSLMGVTGTSQDVVIGLMIRAASRYVQTRLGYPLTVQSYQETVPSFDTRRLTLSVTPLRAVTRVLDATDSGSAAELDPAQGDYRVDDAEAGFLSRGAGFYWTAPIEQNLTPQPRAGQEVQPWLVEYVAGWSYGGVSTDSPNWSTEGGTTSTGRTLPEDIELAAAMHVTHNVQNPDNVISEKLGDISVTYRNPGGTASERPRQVWDDLLEPYERMR